MQVILNVGIAYYVDNHLRTAQVGEVISDFPDSEATSLVERGIARWVVEETAAVEVPVVPVKPARKRGA
jgi:hypothetical protein